MLRGSAAPLILLISGRYQGYCLYHLAVVFAMSRLLSFFRRSAPPSAPPHFSNPFRLLGRQLFFTCARLYGDRLELTGWEWKGRYKRVLPLEAIEDVHWWTGLSDCNLEIRLQDGESLGLWMRGAGQWKYALEEAPEDTVRRAPRLPKPHAPRPAQRKHTSQRQPTPGPFSAEDRPPIQPGL